MSSIGKIYIDAEGIKRGYYVYVHRETETGHVFYVGKGQGKRAWNKSQRSGVWKSKVDELGDAWEVVIVKDDLSEIEAFELEEVMVGRLGGPHSVNKNLANIFPGGENPISVGVGIQLTDWIIAYNEAYWEYREFADLHREEQEFLVRTWGGQVYEIIGALNASVEGTEQNVVKAGIDDVEYYVDAKLAVAMDFLKRRVAWKEFCLNLEDLVDELDREFLTQLNRKVRPSARKIAKLSKEFLDRVDSGNKVEAKKLATEKSRCAR